MSYQNTITVGYNTMGHICPATKRIAVSVLDMGNSMTVADRPFWLYSIHSEELGLDPWTLCDSIDFSIAMDTACIWAASGRQINVSSPDAIAVYLQVADPEAKTLMEMYDLDWTPRETKANHLVRMLRTFDNGDGHLSLHEVMVIQQMTELLTGDCRQISGLRMPTL